MSVLLNFHLSIPKIVQAFIAIFFIRCWSVDSIFCSTPQCWSSGSYLKCILLCHSTFSRFYVNTVKVVWCPSNVGSASCKFPLSKTQTSVETRFHANMKCWHTTSVPIGGISYVSDTGQKKLERLRKASIMKYPDKSCCLTLKYQIPPRGLYQHSIEVSLYPQPNPGRAVLIKHLTQPFSILSLITTVLHEADRELLRWCLFGNLYLLVKPLNSFFNSVRCWFFGTKSSSECTVCSSSNALYNNLYKAFRVSRRKVDGTLSLSKTKSKGARRPQTFSPPNALTATPLPHALWQI